MNFCEFFKGKTQAVSAERTGGECFTVSVWVQRRQSNDQVIRLQVRTGGPMR